MEYYGFAIQRLKDYDFRKGSIPTIKLQIETLEAQYLAIKSPQFDGMPRGSGEKNENMLIENIAKRDELRFNLDIAEREVLITEKALSALSDDEKVILELFYISRPYNHIQKLMDKLHVSQSELFRRKDLALRKFTMAAYGIVEI